MSTKKMCDSTTCAAQGHAHNDDEDDDDEDEKQRMAQDDRCWDGNWSCMGLGGMFVVFEDVESLERMEWAGFLEEQQLQQQQEKTSNTGKASSSPLNVHDEFVNLDISSDDQEGWARLHMEVLRPRGLHIASGVMRRVAEGSCPKRIRIRTLDTSSFEELLQHKQAGNKAFSEHRYEEAIERYDEALLLVDSSSFVAPKKQIEQIVNVLSNQAECYLRLKKFKAAGQAATDALLFENGHEKSRMRRAKAALAIAGAPYLLQAQVDLEEIANDEEGQQQQHSRAGVKQAKEYLEQLEEVLEMEKTTLLEKHGSDYDWDLYVRMMKAKCW